MDKEELIRQLNALPEEEKKQKYEEIRAKVYGWISKIIWDDQALDGTRKLSVWDGEHIGYCKGLLYQNAWNCDFMGMLHWVGRINEPLEENGLQTLDLYKALGKTVNKEQ